MEAIEPFLGVWWSIPEDGGPERAVYTLLLDAEGLFGHVRWQTGDAVQQMSFRAVPDGSPQPIPDADGASLVCDLCDGALRTRVFFDERCVASAERRLDGETLVVTQRAEGEETVQRFRRTKAKQVLVYRRDLKMRKGKIAAQCAHGSMGVFFRRASGPTQRLEIPLDGPMAAWARGRFAKVVLSCEGEEDLLRIAELAKSAGVPHMVITDAGHTEFHGVPTRTVVAVGPAAVEEIDPITGPDGAVACKLA